MHSVPGACGLMIVVLLAVWAAGCSHSAGSNVIRQEGEDSVSAPNVVWREGEDFVSAPEPTEMSPEQEYPASGFKVLNRGALQAKGNVTTYEVDVPVDMADAKIVLRYARPWLRSVPNTPVKLTLVGPVDKSMDGRAPMTEVEEDFGNTNGWGGRTVDYKLRAVAVGNLAKGKYSLTLTALADNGSMTIDGFFIASGDFKISSEELDPLIRVKIASDGCFGLRRPSIVVRQDAEKSLILTARSFDPSVKCAFGEAVIKDADGTEKSLAAEQGAAEGVVKLDVSALADGDYVLTVRMERPAAELETPLLLAGKFLGGLDENIAELSAAADRLKTSEDAAAKRCELDLEHIAAYLGGHRARLMLASETDENVWRPSLQDYGSWIRFPEPLLRNMRKTVVESQETLKRLAAGEDPYEGRFGELRRGYRSAASGKVEAYRVFVPTSYATADKTPLILYLHGSGDDENYFGDLHGGAVLRGLEKRGYMAVMPKWYSEQVSEDMPKLLEMILKEYPKIDPERVYCTGLSMGGFGTYRLAAARPDLFAAVACAAGTGSVELAENLKNVPLLILQGEADPVVSPEGARIVAAKLKELGYVVELHTFPNHGHGYKLPDYLDLSLDFFDKCTRKP